MIRSLSFFVLLPLFILSLQCKNKGFRNQVAKYLPAKVDGYTDYDGMARYRKFNASDSAVLDTQYSDFVVISKIAKDSIKILYTLWDFFPVAKRVDVIADLFDLNHGFSHRISSSGHEHQFDCQFYDSDSMIIIVVDSSSHSKYKLEFMGSLNK